MALATSDLLSFSFRPIIVDQLQLSNHNIIIQWLKINHKKVCRERDSFIQIQLLLPNWRDPILAPTQISQCKNKKLTTQTYPHTFIYVKKKNNNN